MKFHEKVNALRKERSWSQGELARKIGIHLGHLSRIENGKSSPSIDILKKLTEAFEVSADYLLNDESDELAPVILHDKNLSEKIRLIEILDDKDRETIVNVIESMLTKKKMLDLLMNNKAAS
jgi:transcriptional regulator with XRE-family HTH domain